MIKRKRRVVTLRPSKGERKGLKLCSGGFGAVPKSVLMLCFFLGMRIGIASAQSTGTPSRNDHFFPAATSAKPFIDYDARGFLINGKRVFITSADMDYARVPRALWHDRLLRLKRAGFNAIEMYTFWNFHEAKEGQFNFSGDHDLDAYLKMIKDLGMYAIVRVGPYYCGEWNLGGYPIWLKFKPGLRVREDNPQFIATVDRFFDRLMPIVTKNQINHGGPVIMVQLENEHRAAWGTVTPNNYFKHLIDKTVSPGLQVPYFFSGMHSGNDPSGDNSNLDDPTRPNPWFSAEYWGVWFLNYGPQELDSTLYDRRTWKIIAHGGNGYNVYMAHGGSNFGYDNDKENAASYDYGAAVGQTGDLRPIYYAFKRANWFAQSFKDVLANSVDTKEDLPSVTDTNIKVTARKSPAGTIVFLDNQDSVAVKFTLKPSEGSAIKTSAEIKLAAGELLPVVQNYRLTPQVAIAWSPSRIYAIAPQGNATTIVVSGAAGSQAGIFFKVDGSPMISDQQNFDTGADNGAVNFHAVVAASQPDQYQFSAGGHTIRIIVVNDELSPRVWLAEANGQTHIIIGPHYSADLVSQNGKLSLTTERPWLNAINYPTWIFKPDGKVVKDDPRIPMIKRRVTLPLSAWQVKDASAPVNAGYADKTWKLSKDPLQMGADGDITADAWYRAKIKVTRAGRYNLRFTRQLGRAQLYLDGKRVDTGEVFDKTQQLTLKAGATHTIALFAAHDGRNKLIFRVGELDTIDAKGISGPVTLQKADGKGQPIAIHNWRMRGGPCDSPLERGEGCVIRFANTALQPHSPSRPLLRREVHTDNWSVLPAVIKPRPHFYRATLNLGAVKPSYAIWRVNTTSLSYGSVWINGHNLGRYPEKIRINGMYIPECWLKAGTNTLVIYDENGATPDKVTIEAEQAASKDTATLQF